MHTAMLGVFWCCVVLVAWVYCGYPLALRCGLFGRPNTGNPAAAADESACFCPNISVIVPAHNEEHAIAAKIRNVLDSDYPRERIEILVGSDGSSDRTAEIVEQFRDDGVGFISFPQQRGKSAIQNGLVSVANGSILVFTDADCLLPRGALRYLVEHFRCPAVGLVTGAPKYRNARETPTAANEGLYLRYETWLRNVESDRGLLVMASGSLFALRRSLWTPLAANQGDDFALPLHVVRSGRRNILEPRVSPVTNLPQSSPRSLLRLKIRIISKDFRALLASPDLLNPFHYGPISIALCSHKLLRWFVPYLLVAMFVSNLCLLNQTMFQFAMVLQVAFCAAAITGVLAHDKIRFPLFSVPASFCIVNFAAAVGILKAISGRASGVWQPDRRASKPAAQTSVFQRNQP